MTLSDDRQTARTDALSATETVELMGWSNSAIAKRYMHTNEELVSAIAAEVGGHIWADDDEDDQGGPTAVPVPA